VRRLALIPARYAATRFPGKLVQRIGGKEVIRHTYDNTVATGLFDADMVVTDSDLIYDLIVSHGGEAVMSIGDHESGTDRIAEAAADLDYELIVNVQGDEPFVNVRALELLLNCFDGAEGKSVRVASLMQIMKEQKLIEDPNYVKVAVDLSGNALFFSRSVIPYQRDITLTPVYYEHIGIYAFRKQALLDFIQWPLTPLESAEKVECLRYLEHGVPIKMVLTEYMGVEIDTIEDLQRAESYLKEYQKR